VDVDFVGELGKFGVSELSDISGFVHLMDGKVVSSSDYGRLLVWEGGSIKCEIVGKGGQFCHKGAIHVVMVEEGELLTAGEDGYVRVWDLEAVDNADAPNGTESRLFQLEPLDEMHIGKDVKVNLNLPRYLQSSRFAPWLKIYLGLPNMLSKIQVVICGWWI
jgi:hypothetical protein